MRERLDILPEADEILIEDGRIGHQLFMNMSMWIQNPRESSPWFQIKESREDAGTTIYVVLKAIDSLKILFAPFLPFSSERLNGYLGYDDRLFGRQYTETFEEEGGRQHEALCYDSSGAAGVWQPSNLPPGQALRRPDPLFEALDESVIEEERARLGMTTT